MLNRILAVAVVAGALTGVLVTGLHMVWAVPLILEAETYETRGETAGAGPAEKAPAAAHAPGHAPGHTHDHGAAPGEEPDGARPWLTLLANVVVGVAGALIMAAVLALVTGATWLTGLAMGVAAFLAFGLAPSLGLPPELPGTAAAELGARQVWWAGTAAATLLGLALVVHGPLAWLKALGLAALLLPHLIGAPAPAVHEALAPESLQHAFIAASLTASAAFWMLLGGLTGYFALRFGATGAKADSA